MDARKPRTGTDSKRDKTRQRSSEGPQPAPQKKPQPEPKAPLSASYTTGELATSHGPEGRKRYIPAKPFQAAVSLNKDSIRGQKDILSADPHGLETSVLLLQDHRLNETEALEFIQNASRKVFRFEGQSSQSYRYRPKPQAY